MPDDVQFQSPTTGKVQAVPPEHWEEALKLGYTPTTHKVMYSPDGQRGMVPNAELRQYMKQGYQTTPKTPVERAQEGRTGVAGALAGMIPPSPTGGRSPLDPKFWYDKDAAKFDPTGPSTAYHDLTRPLPKNLPTEVLGAGKAGGNAIYRGASLVAPLAGIDPEAMEAASARGDTLNVATQAAVPATLAVGGPLAAKALPSPRGAVGKFIYTPEGRVMGLKEATIRKVVPDPYAPERAAKTAAEAKAAAHAEYAKRLSDIEEARQKELADAEKLKEQDARARMRRGKEQGALDKKSAPPPPPSPFAGMTSTAAPRTGEVPKPTGAGAMTSTAPPPAVPGVTSQDLITRTKRIVRPGEMPTPDEIKRAGDMTQVPDETLIKLANFGDELARNELTRRIKQGKIRVNRRLVD